MMYNIKPTNQFKRDLKAIQRRGYNLTLLTEVIQLLADGKQLPEKNRDHPLSGTFVGCRECHILPDWLLIYELSDNDLILYLTRTGTHSDLFK
ncbi:MAG: type II toxin-antitoxin system YafQ family toxin [Clostridia bacterium]|nr:type II toxin-antitoxin system YafQ family toxin [Clostridia bacterium]